VEALEAYSRLVYIPVHRMAVRDPMRSMAPYSNSLQRTKRHALCKDEEHNARLFATPLSHALGLERGR
jgi:hypothetical protein